MITKRLLPILLLTVSDVLVSMPTAAQTTASQAPEDEQRLRALLREGALLLKEGRYDEARKYLLDAWQIRANPDVGAVLGQAELLVGLYRDAATHLDWTLRNFSPARPEKALQSVRDLFSQAMTHVAVLRITANRQGVEVRVDGQTVGTAPLGSDVFVDPGKHVVSAGAEGATGEQSVATDAGQTYTLTLDAGRNDAVAAPMNNSASVNGTAQPLGTASAPTFEPEGRRSLVPVIVGGVAFVAGVGTAIGFHLAANSQQDKVQNYQNAHGPGGCSNGIASPSNCAAQRDAAKSVERDRNWGNAGIVVAGTALVATSLYWLWPRPHRAIAAHNQWPIQVSGCIQPQGSAVWITGEF